MAAPELAAVAVVILAVLGWGVLALRRPRRRSPLSGPHREESFRPAAPATTTSDEAPITAGRCFAGLSKNDAELLLDWLQAHGCSDCELSYEPKTGFTVRVR
ncbi:MAG: hypothetical protein L0Z62_15085 [Gemmataceae bacterium]|nr:hypothetical protein [Gemmataceae bacterium]